VHPVFNTVEFRICDVPLTIKETTVIAALFQAICAKIYKLRHQNLNFINYQRSLINENKWRASRYGIEGTLIDFGKETEVETKALIYELLDFVDDTLNDLGSRDILSNIDALFKTGTGADRQLAVYQKNESFIDVVDYIHDQFLA
jgi:carboxylate-amine ligase